VALNMRDGPVGHNKSIGVISSFPAVEIL